MKLAIIGSRDLMIYDLEKYVPKGITEIISGGAKGIDHCAKEFAFDIGIKYTEFVIDICKRQNKKITVYVASQKGAYLKA